MIAEFENELREISQAKSKLEAREKEIKNQIKKEHTSENSQTYGGVQVQVCNGYFTTEFDLETFKNENEELFNKYQKECYKAPTIKIVLVKKVEEK